MHVWKRHYPLSFDGVLRSLWKSCSSQIWGNVPLFSTFELLLRSLIPVLCWFPASDSLYCSPKEYQIFFSTGSEILERFYLDWIFVPFLWWAIISFRTKAFLIFLLFYPPWFSQDSLSSILISHYWTLDWTNQSLFSSTFFCLFLFLFFFL